MGFQQFLGRNNTYTDGYAFDNGKEEAKALKTGIKISEILFPRKKYEYRLKRPKLRKKQPDAMIFEADESIKARNINAHREENKSLSEMFESNKNTALKRLFKKKEYERSLCPKEILKTPIEVIDWEKDVTIVEDAEKVDLKTQELIDTIFEEERWEDQIVYDESFANKFKPFVTLWINDPSLIFDLREDKKRGRRRLKENGNRPLKSRFNISNDKYYDFEVSTKSSLGTHGVQHSIPALKLHPTFYRTNFTNEELRNFHKPPIRISAGCFRFSPLRKLDSKTSNIIKKVTELELSAESSFQLFEYSEEHPPLIQNVGMVSLINNFFRKGGQLEESPIERYQSITLEQEDPSPFFGYGDIKPGESMLIVTNNLFKAPLFRHGSTDFICIKKEGQLYLRKIEDILLVGQTLPFEVVYSPNSRKYNVFCKNRLKNTVYRLFNTPENASGIPFSMIDNLFSHFSEGSKRKWLKEFAEVVKKGRENFWVLKSGEAVLSEEDLRKLVTPENVCQYESMLAAERRLLDMGYEVSERFGNEDEIRLAPWNMTKNFVSVCNGKGLLELVGIGDPTGIGEGLSFVKVRFKKGNESEDRKLFNEIQSEYKNKIQSIWNKQAESLGSSRSIEPEEVVEKPEEKEKVEKKKIKEKLRPYITIKRVFIVGDERVTEEEDVYDSKVVEGYLKYRAQIKTEDKKNLKCGSCGQSGHMKTNRICPKFSEKRVTKKTKESLKRKAKNLLIEKQLGLINYFFTIQYSVAFHRPVSTKKFPDYRNFVKSPIDLSMIKSKVKAFKYKKFSDFLGDITLLKDNCKTYNGIDHSLTKIAQSMVDKAFEVHIKNKAEIEQAEKTLEDEPPKTYMQSLPG